MTDALDIMEIVKHDSEEEQWRYDLITTIERIHYKNPVPVIGFAVIPGIRKLPFGITNPSK